MTPFKNKGHHIVLELLYNNKHKICFFVVENAFENDLKKNLTKFDLHTVFFVPNAFIAWCLLHNYYNLILHFIFRKTNEFK